MTRLGPVLAAVLALAALAGCHEGSEGDACQGVACSGHGSCRTDGSRPWCNCDPGYVAEDLECVPAAGDGDGDSDADEDGSCEATGGPCDGPDEDDCPEGIWECVDGSPSCTDDTDDTCGCPGNPEMAWVRGASPDFCIDRYEASQYEGTDPASVSGLAPWTVGAGEEGLEACARVGKHLCTEEEWRAACGGSSELAYPYGEEHEPGACNDADGGRGSPWLTGSGPGCQGSLEGLFDMSGNVAELVSSGASFVAAGGSYRSPDEDARCSSVAAPAAVPEGALGFRCCMSR